MAGELCWAGYSFAYFAFKASDLLYFVICLSNALVFCSFCSLAEFLFVIVSSFHTALSLSSYYSQVIFFTCILTFADLFVKSVMGLNFILILLWVYFSMS